MSNNYTRVSDWFESVEDFTTLTRDAIREAKGDGGKIFAEEMSAKVKEYGFNTYLTQKQLNWLCQLADWDVPARRQT